MNAVSFSVLDINDYNGKHPGSDHLASPGKRRAQAGPDILLGYNARAPADTNGVSMAIITDWISKRDSLGDIDAWMEANRERRAWNACAIEKDVKYVYFKQVIRKKIKYRTEVKAEDW